MNDKEYFDNYKNSFTTFYSYSEDLAYLKDADFRYQAATEKMLQRMGLNNIDQVLDKTTEELPTSPEMIEFLPKFQKQDLQIQKDGKCGIYLNVLPYPYDLSAYVIYKTPIINPETGNFVGIRAKLRRLMLPHVAKLLFKVHGTKGLLITQKAPKNSFKEYSLTPMQHVVLFLCLNNYSYSEIALFMSEFIQETSPIQVNGYLEDLKLIFHVRTKNQLIEKAIGLNFNTYLPHDLFKFTTLNLANEVTSMIDLSDKN